MTRIIAIVICIFSLPNLALAAPSVSGVSGSVNHGQNITISGSGFGTKNPAAPALWQDFENKDLGTNPLPAEGWYNNATRLKWTVDNDTKDIAPPHSKSTRYLAGEHAVKDTNISLAFSAASIQNIWVIYAYRRFDPTAPTTDPTYCTNQGQVVDLNYKEWWFNHNCSDSDFTSWYHSSPSPILQEMPIPGSTDAFYSSNTAQNTLCDGGQINNVNFGVNPSLAWRHNEWIMRQNPGYLAITNYAYYNGSNVRTVHAARSCAGNLIEGDATCAFHPTEYKRNICTVDFGSFTRWCGYGQATSEFPADSFFRYLDDVYIDNTFSRVLICNNATYTSATICEPQIPSAWADGSITARVNQGALSNGTAYAFIFDSANMANATGYPVTLAGSGDTTPPSAPVGLSVL